jgi:hypothetical protein
VERYPALSLIVKFGVAGPAVLAVLLALGAVVLFWPCLGVLAVLVGVATGAVVFLASKALVELIVIVTEMLVPR